MLDNKNFPIPDTQFKALLASLLPPSWDIFTDPYVASCSGLAANINAKGTVPTQEFIGILKKEYLYRKSHSETAAHHSYQSTSQFPNKQHLVDHFSTSSSHNNNGTTVCCCNCNLIGHQTDDCKWLGQIKCQECSWFGYMEKNCRHKEKKRKNEDSCKDKLKKKKGQTHETQEETKPKDNTTYSMQEPKGIASIEEITSKNDEDNIKDCGCDTCNPSDVFANDEHLSYHDWLANTATTSHVTNS